MGPSKIRKSERIDGGIDLGIMRRSGFSHPATSERPIVAV